MEYLLQYADGSFVPDTLRMSLENGLQGYEGTHDPTKAYRWKELQLSWRATITIEMEIEAKFSILEKDGDSLRLLSDSEVEERVLEYLNGN